MSGTKPEALDHALQTAHRWVADVAREFGTEDQRFAYRALRAWLHTLRDRLTVDGAANFAAQLPTLLRGVFYDGWEPARVPVKYGPDEYVLRFADEARIPVGDVPRAAATVAHAVGAHLSPGQLPQTVAQLPHGLRSLLVGSDSLEPPVGGQPSGEHAGHGISEAEHVPRPGAAEDTTPVRLQRLEARVASLVEAVSVLARGLEEVPGEEPEEERAAKAARLAHEILLTAMQ